MKLIIANKRYSSWSLRVWVAMKYFGIHFDEQTIFLRQKDTHRMIDRIRKDSKLPILIDGDLRISESIAILEYLAEKYPDRTWWPRQRKDRALARSYASEMHGGFMSLRSQCPMNCFARPMRSIPDGARDDARRIMDIWKVSLTQKKKGGFLFGPFGIVDAMFVPVAIRLSTYGFKMDRLTDGYCQRLLALPTVKNWIEGARLETERIEAYEIAGR